MSDDEDYMSDKFLQGTEKYLPPSLLYRHSDKRELELMKKKAEIEAKMKEKKSIKHIEIEKREEGLSSAITSSNKGFEMLMKMGYKPGQGIGKSESGIVEPIGVEVKSNRHGLGKVNNKQNETKTKDRNDPAMDKLNSKHMKDFRSRVAQKKMEELLKIDLLKSQKACEQLDTKIRIEKPIEPWFWLLQTEEKDANDESEIEEDFEDNDDDESLQIDEKLEILTKYLRSKHFYCVWCGTAFNDEDDLKDNCPGSTRDDH